VYRRFLIAAAFGASTIAFVFFHLLNWFRYQSYLGDYLIFWRAARGWQLYTDLHLLSFAYPPTSLFLLSPFGALPFWWALAIWTAAGMFLLWWAGKRLVGLRAASLGLLTLSCLWLALSGQISGFIVPLIIVGIMDRRAWVKGLCFAAAGVIKPQALIAAPIALLAQRNFRAIGWGALFAAALVLGSVALWGFELWLRWFDSLGSFHSLLVEREMDRADVGIAGFALKLGLPAWLFILGIPLGVVAVWRTFQRSEATDAERYAAFACGSVLLSAYTLGYDLAALCIVAVAFLLDRQQSKNMWRASAMIVSYVLTAPGILLMAYCLARERDHPA
jgi:hypothetical protein